MKRTILKVTFLISLVFILGTVGALEYGSISCTQAIIQGLVGVIVLAASAHALHVDDEHYWRCDDEEDM